MHKQALVQKIDHTILKPDATFSQVKETILYAGHVGAATVCLQPAYVSLAAQLLQESDTAVCTVIGFPLGANSSFIKAKETENAYAHGAREMDMVLNISALKSGNHRYVLQDIQTVVQATPALVKVILETCYLTPQEITTACELAEEAGAAFVKTSTGFGPKGATVENVKLMRQNLSDSMQIKAAGGIATLADVQAMLQAGANRIGLSRTAAILKECEE